MILSHAKVMEDETCIDIPSLVKLPGSQGLRVPCEYAFWLNIA